MAPLGGVSGSGSLQNQGSFNSQSDFTRSEQSHYSGAESCSNELSYTSLKMASDKGAKRQKRTDSMELGALFDFDRSHELEKDVAREDGLLEGTYDRMLAAGEPSLQPQQINDAPDVMRRQLSIDNLNTRPAVNIDDCYLERSTTDNQRGSMFFFGLALVFGAVGVIGTSGIDLKVD